MFSAFSPLLTALGLLTLVSAAPSVKLNKRYTVEESGIKYTVFEHAATSSSIKYVKNSGICETTPGVNQYSGYLSVGPNQNMWFWFFEARENATTAPLSVWFNGGPGCSSMIGLFQEHGPCQFYNNETEPSLNKWSWNNYANMLYVDQPIGTGFSYGNSTVNSTVTAAPYVWALLQAFYDNFPEYESRAFGVFTESYGGHYGPEFASYIQEQNAGIAAGSVTGERIDLVALGINNGWFDSRFQEKAYIDYAWRNDYKQIIRTQDQYDDLLWGYEAKCLPALRQCRDVNGTDEACSFAAFQCGTYVDSPITSMADFDVYDVRAPSDDPNPPNTYVDYLNQESVIKAIGAQVSFTACPDAPYNAFSKTGDDARSFLPTLTEVVQSGIQVLIWAGDTDWICNWIGNLAVAEAIEYPGKKAFASAPLCPYTVSGKSYGEYKTAENLSWLKVREAGHEVPYYQPEVSLQAFRQTMEGKNIFAT